MQRLINYEDKLFSFIHKYKIVIDFIIEIFDIIFIKLGLVFEYVFFNLAKLFTHTQRPMRYTTFPIHWIWLRKELKFQNEDKLTDLPMLPKDLELVVIKQTSKQYYAVRTQMNRKDVKEIIIATDAGREGELVARWMMEKANIRKPVKRLWISSVTDKAIRDGFKQLKPGRNYENLYDSAVARSEADWYVGLNATRALTTTHQAQLSSGRVQTPTLAMVAEREKRMSEFKS